MGQWAVERSALALALALGASGATVLALWPRLAWPAWPGVSLALVALALVGPPGPIRTRAPATVLAGGATLLGGAQIALLWALGAAMR